MFVVTFGNNVIYKSLTTYRSHDRPANVLVFCPFNQSERAGFPAPYPQNESVEMQLIEYPDTHRR